MKHLKTIAMFVALNAAVCFGLYQWKVNHLEGAGNLVTAWLVFVGLVGLVAGIAGDKTWFKEPRINALAYLGRFMTLATAGVLFFFGHFALGAFYLFGQLCISIARDREPKSTTTP